jgi:hypothetical protein
VKESQLSSLSTLQENLEGVRTFLAEVMTHGADLKFLTISGQKFIDISKVKNCGINIIVTLKYVLNKL